MCVHVYVSCYMCIRQISFFDIVNGSVSSFVYLNVCVCSACVCSCLRMYMCVCICLVVRRYLDVSSVCDMYVCCAHVHESLSESVCEHDHVSVLHMYTPPPVSTHPVSTFQMTLSMPSERPRVSTTWMF